MAAAFWPVARRRYEAKLPHFSTRLRPRTARYDAALDDYFVTVTSIYNVRGTWQPNAAGCATDHRQAGWPTMATHNGRPANRSTRTTTSDATKPISHCFSTAPGSRNNFPRRPGASSFTRPPASIRRLFAAVQAAVRRATHAREYAGAAVTDIEIAESQVGRGRHDPLVIMAVPHEAAVTPACRVHDPRARARPAGRCRSFTPRHLCANPRWSWTQVRGCGGRRPARKRAAAQAPPVARNGRRKRGIAEAMSDGTGARVKLWR